MDCRIDVKRVDPTHARLHCTYQPTDRQYDAIMRPSVWHNNTVVRGRSWAGCAGPGQRYFNSGGLDPYRGIQSEEIMGDGGILILISYKRN